MSNKKSSSLVPTLRFPEFREAGEWVGKKISEFAKITTGNKDTQNKVDNGEFPFFVRSQTVERINSYSFDGEAILTAGDGVGVGKVFHYITGKFDFHQRVYCIYNFKKDISGKYFYLYFSTHFYRRVMQLSAKNSVDSVRMFMIADMPIMLPSIKEQQKIAACLSSLDELITAHSQKLNALKKHKKGLMQQLFPAEGETVPTLRFPEFREAGEWLEKKLSELFEFRNGLNADKEKYGKGHKYISVLDIISGRPITYDSIINSVEITNKELNLFKVEYGDIVFQRSSETQEEAGQANVYLDHENHAIFGGFVIRGKKIAEYIPLFMNALLASRRVRKEIISHSAGSTRYNIGQETLSAIIVLVPCISEQQKIAACLSSLDELITAQSQKLDALKKHKKGLMQQLFPAVEE